MGFTKFGLSDQIMQGIRAEGHSKPTPIQTLAIPPAVEGKDVIGCAQTGTGKTAAFVLPILNRLSRNHAPAGGSRNPRALVLTPTRELAQQVQNVVSSYGRFLTLRSVSIYGGASMENQLKLLRRGTDILVATPGRLLDHMQRGSISLASIEVLVLDEADRMLDMGFIHDVRKITSKVPENRQTMLFSATLDGDIGKLAANVLRNPVTVEDGERHNTVETIDQHFYSAPQHAKTDLLLHALETEKMNSVLIFSRTKHGADKVSRRLERTGITAVAIHSNRTQSQRERALDGFKRGKFRVLVATDIAARGIDVMGISHVINYDIPHEAEDYIHRIGRTGRAGASGDAITFVGNDEQQYLRRIEQFVGKRFPVKTYPGFTAPAGVPQSHTREARHDQPRHPKHPTARPKQARAHTGAKRRFDVVAPRKKKTAATRMDSFSSDSSGAGWSNY